MVSLIRVRTDWTLSATNPGITNLYFPQGLTTPDAAAAAVGAFWTVLNDAISNTVSWATRADLEVIDAATGELTDVLTGVDTFGGTGTLTGQPLPPATQGLIHWSTNAIEGGRRVVGRTFIPGATENLNDTGVPNSDYLDIAGAAAAALIDGGSTNFTIWSRKNGVGVLAVSGTPWTEWAVQRKRRS